MAYACETSTSLEARLREDAYLSLITVAAQRNDGTHNMASSCSGHRTDSDGERSVKLLKTRQGQPAINIDADYNRPSVARTVV